MRPINGWETLLGEIKKITNIKNEMTLPPPFSDGSGRETNIFFLFGLITKNVLTRLTWCICRLVVNSSRKTTEKFEDAQSDCFARLVNITRRVLVYLWQTSTRTSGHGTISNFTAAPWPRDCQRVGFKTVSSLQLIVLNILIAQGFF